MSSKPRVFVGSSPRGLPVAEVLRAALESETETTLWHEDAFGLPDGSLETLETAARNAEFAVFVLTQQDLDAGQESGIETARDNVLLELGLFVGAVGRARTFLVHPRDEPPRLPTSLAGLGTATYGVREDGNLQAALGPTCTRLKDAIRRALPSEELRLPHVARRRRRRALGKALAQVPGNGHPISNLSVSGALLETPGEIPIGRLLDLELRLEDGQVARVTAQVVRVQQPDWGLIGGVGVKFIRYGPGAHDALERYMDDESEADAVSTGDGETA